MRNGFMAAIAAFIGFSALAPGSAAAAIHCVRNHNELQQALTAAATSPGDDEIRIREGIYTTFNGSFVYTSQNPGWLTLSGGWYLVDGNDCAQARMDASRTILEGAGQSQVVRIIYLPPEGTTATPSSLAQRTMACTSPTVEGSATANGAGAQRRVQSRP